MKVFRTMVASSLIVLALATPTAIVVTRGIPELTQDATDQAGEVVELPAGAEADSAPVVRAEIERFPIERP